MHGYFSRLENEDDRLSAPDIHSALPDLTRVLDRHADPIPIVGDSPNRTLVWRSAAMQRIVNIIDRLADKDNVAVLVIGESGTGKTMLCKIIHDRSRRKNRPFVEIGCSSIPDNLIESELFGYEKGAFTDAKGLKKGLVEIAEGGTLFLDEIGDMPLALQSKLLSLIEERSFRKVGGLRQLSANVRIIAATNRNLTELVHDGAFRLDLYYRLNVVTIEVPPLSSRPEDIRVLIDHYLRYFGAKYESGAFGISKDALDAMLKYPWPGNVRELKNLIERFVIMSRFQPIEVDDLPGYMLTQHTIDNAVVSARHASRAQPDLPVNLSLRALEEASIRAALRTTKGNQRKAAGLLDITRDALRYRMKKFGIMAERLE